MENFILSQQFPIINKLITVFQHCKWLAQAEAVRIFI